MRYSAFFSAANYAHRRLSQCLISLLAGLPLLVSAQAATITLSSNQLVTSVLSNNAGLSAKVLQAQAAKQHINTMGVFDDPTLHYSLPPKTIGSKRGTRHSIGISQTIPWAGTRALETKIAQQQAKAAQLSQQDGRLLLTAQARQLWAQWWYVHQALTINSTEQQLLHKLQSVVKTQYANGLGLQQDLLQVQTASVHSHHQHIALLQQVQRLSAQINQLLNQPPRTRVAKPGAIQPIPTLPSANHLQQLLLNNAPPILQANAKTAAAAATVDLIKKQDYPKIQLNAHYNELMENTDNHVQIGISVTLPLNTGKRSAAKSAASAHYNSQRLQAQDLHSELAATMEQQRSMAYETQLVVDLYRSELIPKSEQTLQAARADYEAGRGEFANIIRAKQQLLSAQLDVARNRSQHMMAIATIDHLSGGQLWPVTTATTHSLIEVNAP